ncbi:flagellar hook protein FlgE [Burkholderia perseverans]|uniref:flagellar hook protein FlgE n=1 Tax=Burkholderia perseverans TaxID=2615214 RepID=UPI001FED7D1E|nr:flagellar hook-basal body complex protein [Burkholderia perseverans]
MLDSIYIAMSGLSAYSRGLQTISNNVANLNTAGFKSSTPQFADLYYGQRYAPGSPGNPNVSYAGSGVEYGYASLNFAQGDTHASDGQLDLAIQGDGFLTVLDGQVARYQRTGQFAVEPDGSIRDKANGLQLAMLTPGGDVTGLSIAGKQLSPPQATTTVKFTDNLSSGATSASIPSIDVYDANGGKHTLKVDLTPDSSVQAGRWKAVVTDENGATVQTDFLQFNGGVPDPAHDRIDVTLSPANGPLLTVSLDFSSGVTNFSAGTTSTLRVDTKDGYGTGTLSSLSVDDSGQLVIQYSNGQSDTLGTIALASFSDPQQLIQLGKGLFDASHAAPAAYRASSGAGVGKLLSGATEASNVDLSTEFGELILIQRGFQASSQVISTANDMLMQLLQMRGQG